MNKLGPFAASADKCKQCKLLQHEVKFLGHVVDSTGVKPDWSPECHTSFVELTALTQAPVLAYADYSLTFIF